MNKLIQPCRYWSTGMKFTEVSPKTAFGILKVPLIVEYHKNYMYLMKPLKIHVLIILIALK